MKVFVTGAAGFIGSHLSEKLNKLGHTIVGVDNFCDYYSPELKRQNQKDLKEQGIEITELELTKDDLTDVTKDTEIAFHFAGQPGLASDVPFEGFLQNNVIVTQRLIEVFENMKTLKMFVNISTSSVYGVNATDDENAAPKPTSHYGVTKLAAEQQTLAYHREKGFPTCSVRPFSIYGERERPEKLFPILIDSILNEKPFPLFEGSEEHLRSYTYVGDLIDGFLAILNNLDKSNGEIFNMGIDKAITTGEAIKIVEEIIGKKAIIDVKPKRPGDQMETRANIDKARRILGYNPPTTPEEGLKKEVEWYKDKIWKKINLYQ